MHFNPIIGVLLNKGVISLNYPIQQIILLPQLAADSLRPMLFLDNDNVVHMIPDTTASLVKDLYIYTADKNTGTISGIAIRYENNRFQVVPT